MALKAILTRDEVGALPEAVKKEYLEKDGKFHLAIEGELPEVVELKTKVSEFRENNIRLQKEADALKTKYDGIDPDEHKRIKTEVEELRQRGINKPDDLDARVQAAVAKATAPLEKKLKTAEDERAAAQQSIADNALEAAITKIATKAGMRANSVPRILSEAKAKFELKDGTLAPKNGVMDPDEPHKPLTAAGWVQYLAKTEEHLFAPTTGSGAPGNRQGAPANAQILINPTPEEMGRNVDKIAKGEIVVQRT